MKSHDGFLLRSDIDEIAERVSEAAQAFAGKTLLLTGGRGFLGRYFSEVFAILNERYLAKPLQVLVLDNLITAGEEGANPLGAGQGRFFQHDVSKPFEWNEPVHYIVHAAGIASPFYYRAYPLETLDVAVQGTRHMLELAKQHHAKLIFFSSSEIYGDPDAKHVPTKESYRGNIACQGPRACYDESKRLGETLCYIYAHQYGVVSNTIRPFNVFGPGMQEADYRVLPNFASRVKAGRSVDVYGAGTQTRTFCYITDAMVGFLLVLLRGTPGEAYNIGNPRPEISMMDLVGVLERLLGKPIPANIIEYPDSYPADEPTRRCPDITKARLQLDYHPQVGLEDGLKRFFDWTDGVYTGRQG